MKHLLSLAVALLLFSTSNAQRLVKLHNLWAKPEVHVLFNGYRISFKIKDINRALELLCSTGDSTWGMTSGLDTAKQYAMELYDTRQLYKSKLEPLIQNVVGSFLLTAGQAEVRYKRKRLKEVIVDIKPVRPDDHLTFIKVFDPRRKKLIFSGDMAVDMYNQDIGIY